MFNEKTSEWSNKQGKEIPVWQMPKYVESKNKAIEIIKSEKYGLSESDFWILMNETKSGKMAYSGLIISHNGCLKINDKLPDYLKFNPECVTINENGWGGTLVFAYTCIDQGLFEVGEVSAKNCKNDYPYAMALKRLIDRVVLKNSKLAFSGIYGEDEADEFRNPMKETEPETKPKETIEDVAKRFKEYPKLTCDNCQKVVIGYTASNGSQITPEKHISYTKARFGKVLCLECAKAAKNAESAE